MAKAEEIWKCPQCGASVDIAPLGLYAEVACPRCYHEEHVHVQLGNFRLEGILGIGGMSVVYRAIDVALDRPVALKVLNDTFREQPERIERFENESAMMARVRHENVTSVYSAGRAYGQFYIAMELVEGKNLESIVSREHPLRAEYALDIVRQVAEGLKAASDAGLLHRDMKPGNVLITTENRVKVIDFGLALDNSADDQEEVIWATPYYVPPETLRRESEDVRTDIYALGMTLRFLLTGVETFEGGMDSLSGLLECKRKLPPICKQYPDLLPSLGDLVDHMTMFAAGRRPENYDELLEEIDEVASELEQETAAPQQRTPRSRLRGALVVVFVLVLGYVTGLYVPRLFRNPDTTPRDRIPAEQMDLTPPFLVSLTKGLDLLDDEEYDEAAREFLGTAETAKDPCVGAAAAYLARILGHAVVLRDATVCKQAQALLERHVKSKKAILPATEKAWRELQNHVVWTDPTPSEWYLAQNAWQGQQEDLIVQADRLVNDAPTSPLTPVRLQELAEHALWLGRLDVVDHCRGKMHELQSKAGSFASVAKLFNRVFDDRIKVRAVAKYVGQRDRIIARLQDRTPTEGDIAELAAIATNPWLPQYFRQQVEVQKEAAELAIPMCQFLMRKCKDSCKPGMSLRYMLWVSQFACEMPLLTCKNQDAGYHVTYAMDGNMETRWRAIDASLGENLHIRLPHPQRLSKVVMHWADDANLTYTLTAFNKGKEVRRAQYAKQTKNTAFFLGNMEVDALSLALNKTDWHRASVCEIEIYDERGKPLYMNRVPSAGEFEIKADSREREHPPGHAMDGNKDTRWCAANGSNGHFLEVLFPEAVKLKKLSVDWETGSVQECEVLLYNNGQLVKTVPYKKESEQSDITLPNVPVTSMRVVVKNVGTSWASIRELKIIGDNGKVVSPASFSRDAEHSVPTYVRRDMDLVASILDVLDVYFLNMDVILPAFERAMQGRAGRGGMQFKMIAESWNQRLLPGKDAKGIPPEPLGDDREAALNHLIDLCGRCYVVLMEKGFSLNFLNFTSYRGSTLNVLDEQTIVFLNRENVVTLVEGTGTVPVLGLKPDREEDYSLNVGEIQPVPEKTAHLFVKNNTGVLLKSAADLQPYLNEVKPNPTPFMFRRVPRFLFIKN